MLYTWKLWFRCQHNEHGDSRGWRAKHLRYLNIPKLSIRHPTPVSAHLSPAPYDVLGRNTSGQKYASAHPASATHDYYAAVCQSVSCVR